MVKVGQKVTAAVPMLAENASVKLEMKMVRGTVIFVHPKRIFHTIVVEYGEDRLKYTIDGV